MKTAEELRREFWREDAEQGGWIRSQYDEIKEILERNDKSWAEEQYRKIKAHAIAQTDFYRAYSVSDEFPVMNKTRMLEHMESCRARGGFSGPLHLSSTSGSTGIPFAVTQDRKKRKRTLADLQVFGEFCDFPVRERMVFFRVLNPHNHRTPEQEEKENIFYVDSADLSPAHLEEMKQVLLEKRPRTVLSFASTLTELAKYIAATEKEPFEAGLFSVLTGGEGCAENERKLLEQVFGCKVYRRYSDMELGIMGQDSGDGSAYRLNWGSFFFECLKLDEDAPTAPGELGRIVVTDLFNYALPLIRYDTGDLGIMECPEGQLPVFREIYGRSRDCVYTVDGRLLSPARISVFMWGIEGVRQWQFIQNDENEYVIRLNVDRTPDTDGILAMLRGALGENANISVEYTDEIPVMASHKRRAIICNYRKHV